jgi:hypothetical protein
MDNLLTVAMFLIIAALLTAVYIALNVMVQGILP